MAYVQDGKMRGPEELGKDRNGIPADWHVDFKQGGHFVCVQFGSFGVSREQAEVIARKILAGLNSNEKGA